MRENHTENGSLNPGSRAITKDVLFTLGGRPFGVNVKKQVMQAEDLTIMPFGKHKGVPLGEVPESYYRWWIGTAPPRNMFPEIQQYFCHKMGITAWGEPLKEREERLKAQKNEKQTD